MKKLVNNMISTTFFLLLIGMSFSNCKTNVVNVKTVSGPNLTQCGGFDWKVKFNIKDKSKKGGWLVQEIAVVQPVYDCNNILIKFISKHFWEAWEIKPNKDYPNTRDLYNINYDDQYRFPDRGRTYGNTNAIGVIKFFEGAVLPPNMRQNNPHTFAGVLHSDTLEPPFWKSEKKFDKHNFINHWNCCVNPPTKSYESVPEITGIQIIPQKTAQMTNEVSKLIDSSPMWTRPCGEEEAIQITEVAFTISQFTPVEIRRGIQEFIDSTRNTIDHLDQHSKVYVLLRSLFDLPSSIPINEVKTFGGWIRPDTNDTLEVYNLQYPIQFTTNNQIIFIGQFEGYIGAEYDALGEFDFFLENYELRRL